MPSVWEKGDMISFSFKNPDTIHKYNLFLNIRNTNEYEFSNLYLIASLKTPNNNQTIDTLEYKMAKPNGEWLGTGFSDIKENKLWFKEDVRFKEEGNYTLTIEHAIRKNGSVLGIESLKGIIEVGFRIEKNKNSIECLKSQKRNHLKIHPSFGNLSNGFGGYFL